MNMLRTILIFTTLILCLFVPVQAVDTSYIYSFDSQIVPNATISLQKQDETLFKSWTTDELGSYDLDQIKSYLQARWSSLPNDYVFYIQVQKYPFDCTWKLQRTDATHIKINDGNVYTTSTVWTYLKNNLRLTEPAGLGYASRTGVTVSSTDSGVQVDGSGDSARIFIDGDIHYRYTVQHVNDSGDITDEFVVYPQLIDSDYYVVFDADEWSYYTVDGSLIEVGITDMRLVGDTVQITGDGYDRLVLRADYDQLIKWNQNITTGYYSNPWGYWHPYNEGAYRISYAHTIAGTSVFFHIVPYTKTKSFWAAGPGDLGFYGWTHSTSNNYYQVNGYIDSDHTSSQDVVIEAYTPDHIDHFIVEMWNGTAGAYQEVLNDSLYTAANLINLNNTSTGLDFALYESGQRGDTVSAIYGNTSKIDQTISAYYGVINRTLMLFTLPADDGADSATSGASQVKLRLTVYYNPEGIIDNSNYTNHGTQHGGVSRVRDGQIDEAIEFDGVDDYIDCGDDSSLNITDAITIEAWVNASSFGPGLNENSIVSKPADAYYFRITDSKMKFSIPGIEAADVANSILSTEQWYHVIVITDFINDSVTYYLNGNQDGQDTTFNSNPVSGNNIVYIGSYNGISFLFNGSIDEVRIYNRVLNSTEISEHYNSTFNNETGLVFHSPMELTPSGAATYEFEDSTNQYYGLDNINGDTMMLYKVGTQNVTYLTYDNLTYDIIGMTVRANEDELIDRWYITYNTTPESQEGAIINQSAIDVDTDSDGDNVPDAFEDANITANKNAQGGELKWDYVWEGAFNIVNSTGYIYYTNLINGSGLVGTVIQTASTTGTVNVSMNDAGAGETYNFTVNSGTVDWFNVTSGLAVGNNYRLKNSTGLIETQTADASGSVNFTTNLVAGTYYIESVEPVITLLSQIPSIIYKNSTGYLNISYGITHDSSGLNNTSVSFIYRNYDWDLSDSNHSIRPPANDLAAVWNFNGRISRAANRNETPGLNFENNDTITGGDTYTWSGLDENSTKLTIMEVNDTYTIININATVHCIMPQMWYLDRTDQQESTKTQLPIHKTQNVLIKFWNFEIYKGNYDFLGVGYTDTSLSSNPALWPSDANPVNFYYVNSSYDPATTGGDPITSGYAVYMGSLNASGWTDHVYSRSNSNYVRGFIDNNYLNTVINTTNISYLYFTSNTESSKPYYINMTNVVSSTNVSFANTNTLWAGNTPPYTPQAYTPNFWVAFMKLNMSLDHKLYVADNNDFWGVSSMNRTNITQALFPPTTPTIDHFHFLGETDYDMDGVYYGNFSIGCGVSSDPDGGDVTHNLTLHYANNLTLVTIINNTFTDKDITHNGVYFDANFSSIPYYSQTDNYTLRLIATDDESETVTVWLNKNFSLDGSPRIISYSPETPVSSSEGENQTFSITTNILGNVTWYIDSVEVFNETSVNNSSYSNSTATFGTYNVTVTTTNTNGTNSMTWDWTVESPKYVPLSIFMGIGGVILIMFISSLVYVGIPAIFTSFLGTTLAFINSVISVNGQLVQNISGIDSSGNVVQGVTVIEVPALCYLFIFIGLIMAGLTIYHIAKEFQYKNEKEYVEVDF